MRRLSIALALAALCLPVSAQAATRVSAFYYPWYATSSHDGGYQHWSQLGHAPPNDIAAAFYPARGVYSSADRLFVARQMGEVPVSGVGEGAPRGGRAGGGGGVWVAGGGGGGVVGGGGGGGGGPAAPRRDRRGARTRPDGG